MRKNSIHFKTKIKGHKIGNMQRLPLVLIEVYLVFTLCLYQFGLFKWDTQNKAQFWSFIFFYHLAFITGYELIRKKKLMKVCDIDKNLNTVNLIFGILLVVYLFFTIIQYKNITGYEYSHIMSLFDDVCKALKNPGQQYYQNNMRLIGYHGQKVITAISGIGSIFSYSLVPLSIYWWERLNFKSKLCFFVCLIFNITINISVGKNSGIFMQLFYVVSSFIIVCIIHGKKVIKRRLSVLFFIAILFVFSFWFFTKGMETRVGSIVIDAEIRNEMQKKELKEIENKAQNNGQNEIQFVETNVVKTSPEKRYKELKMPLAMENLLYGLDNYLTNGYFMFSMSFSEEYEWCYGLGNSAFLRSNIASLFGFNVTERMLESKITNRYERIYYFSSIYTSLANDLHYLGIIVFMFFGGMFTSYIWKDAYQNKNFIAYLFLPLLAVFYLYFPVGNIIGNSIYLFFTFFELLFIYGSIRFLKRKK